MTLQPSERKAGDGGGRGERKAARPKLLEVVCVCVCVLNPHLQRGQHYLFHRGEVGLPEELSLLSKGQDLILVDGAHGGWDLWTTNSQHSALIWDRKIKIGPRDTLRKFPSSDKAKADIAAFWSSPRGQVQVESQALINKLQSHKSLNADQ